MRIKIVARLAIAALALSVASSAPPQEKIEVKIVDGVRHVFNPAVPLKGTVKLEIERTRTLDPYVRSDVGISTMSFTRDERGSVILYDPYAAEGHRYGPDGRYLGLLTKKGQGPGEFEPRPLYRPVFAGEEIWVFGNRKAAVLDGAGRLLKERKLRNPLLAPAGAYRFFTEVTDWTNRDRLVMTLGLVAFDFQGKEDRADLLNAVDTGIIRGPTPGEAYGDEWAAPNFVYAGDPVRELVYYGLNRAYEIRVKDFAGRDRRVVHCAYENVRAKRADIEKILTEASNGPIQRWMIDAYPDRYAAIWNLKVMPKGYLAVERINGPRTVEIDVFSPKGEYLYALIPPTGVDLNRALFFSSGFGTVETEGDSFVYREYRIKNLPEIF